MNLGFSIHSVPEHLEADSKPASFQADPSAAVSLDPTAPSGAGVLGAKFASSRTDESRGDGNRQEERRFAPPGLKHVQRTTLNRLVHF